MKPFQFKKFKVQHEKSAHKVGTDGVLLGTWTNVDNSPKRILDIGSGSGLVALILAQRTTAKNIDAVEIDKDAFQECEQNFKTSIWQNRLSSYNSDIRHFKDKIDYKYDLILSNPPFFDTTSNDFLNSRTRARKQINLNETELLDSVKYLLKNNGRFTVILPFNNHQSFIKKADNKNLFLNKLTQVKGHKNSPIKRSLMQFDFKKKPLIENLLILETSRHQYTESYRNLVKDFYLNL